VAAPAHGLGVTGSLAGASGLAALALIRGSGGRLRGQWVALLGLALAATVPAFGLAYVVADNLR
jgi:hypothetical protein